MALIDFPVIDRLDTQAAVAEVRGNFQRLCRASACRGRSVLKRARRYNGTLVAFAPNSYERTATLYVHLR